MNIMTGISDTSAGPLGITQATPTPQATNPFVALLSGLMSPTAAGTAEPVLSSEAVLENPEALLDATLISADEAVVLSEAAEPALNDAMLAALPDDIAAALAEVAQALNPRVPAAEPVKLSATALTDEPLSDDAEPLSDQLLTPLINLAPTPTQRQGIDAAAHDAASAAPLVSVAATPRSVLQSAMTDAPLLDAETTDAPSQFTSAAPAATLNSTADVLAAIKDSGALSPAVTALKDAMSAAGLATDQADQLISLSAQGAPAPSTLATAASAPAPTALPTASQWTVPGHALLDNSAWSSAMADRLTWLGQNGMTSASLHITPDDLGPIHVRISMSEEGAKVAFSADHHDTQGLIEKLLPKLHSAFEAQGLRLDDVRVQAGASQAAQLDLSQQQSGEQAMKEQAQSGHDSSGRSGGAGASAHAGDAEDNGAPATVATSASNSQLDAYA